MKYNQNTDKRMKVRVTNTTDGRVDTHDNLTKSDIEWIKANPNLHVEVIEVKN